MLKTISDQDFEKYWFEFRNEHDQDLELQIWQVFGTGREKVVARYSFSTKEYLQKFIDMKQEVYQRKIEVAKRRRQKRKTTIDILDRGPIFVM